MAVEGSKNVDMKALTIPFVLIAAQLVGNEASGENHNGQPDLLGRMIVFRDGLRLSRRSEMKRGGRGLQIRD